MATKNLATAANAPDSGFKAIFGTGQAGTAFLRDGWFEAEKEFVWSNGRFAGLELPFVAAVDERYRLAITAWGYVPPKAAPQEVMVFVNGRMLGYHRLSVRSVLSFDFKGEGDPSLRVEFYLPTARSPKECEGSADARELGIALISATIASQSD